MVTLITIIHVIACIFLMLVVLLQAGKGGGVGIAFGGGGGAQQVFGGRGAGSFLEKLTAGTAIVFMLTSSSLAYFASQTESKRLQQRSEKLKKEKEEKERQQQQLADMRQQIAELDKTVGVSKDTIQAKISEMAKLAEQARALTALRDELEEQAQDAAAR